MVGRNGLGRRTLFAYSKSAVQGAGVHLLKSDVIGKMLIKERLEVAPLCNSISNTDFICVYGWAETHTRFKCYGEFPLWRNLKRIRQRLECRLLFPGVIFFV